MSAAAPMEMKMKWDGALIAVSYLVSVQAAYTAILILQMRFSRWLLALGAMCLSLSGIWSMHFIGMAALLIDTHVEYNIGWTIGSALFAYVSTLVAFLILDIKLGKQANINDISIAAHIEAMKTAPHLTIALSAMLIALGVCAMHYTGMHAMEPENVVKVIDWGVVFGSCFIAIFAATAALYFAFVLPITRRFTIPTALVAGVAVCGMHYTGMYGIKYEMNPLDAKGASSTIEEVVLYIVFVSSLLSSSSLAFSSFVYRRKLRQAAASAQEFADNIIAGKFHMLNQQDDDGKTDEERAEEDIREDPMMSQIKQSYHAMGTQMGLLRSFMPASLLAQFENIQHDGDEEEDDSPRLKKSNRKKSVRSDHGVDDEGSVVSYSDSVGQNSSQNRGSNYRSISRRGTVDDQQSGRSRTETVRSGAGTATSASSHEEKMRINQRQFSKGVQKKKVGILSVNMHGFNTKFDPTRLTDYAKMVDAVSEAVRHTRGVIDFFHGDRFMITYNASKINSNFSKNLVLGALEIATDIPGSTCVSIGAASGEALVGNIGSESMLRFSVIGNVVSWASDCEAYCRQRHSTGGTHIVVANPSPDMFLYSELRPLDVIIRKHTEAPAMLCEVLRHSASAEADDEWMYELEKRQQGNQWSELSLRFQDYVNGDPIKALSGLDDLAYTPPDEVDKNGVGGTLTAGGGLRQRVSFTSADYCRFNAENPLASKFENSRSLLRELCRRYPNAVDAAKRHTTAASAVPVDSSSHTPLPLPPPSADDRDLGGSGGENGSSSGHHSVETATPDERTPQAAPLEMAV